MLKEEKNTLAKIVMPHLGILVTTYCNLNCRDCADLIPKRALCHYDIEEIKQDLSKILDIVETIEEVLVIGGEVLMYPQLEEILTFCGAQEKIGRLIITTNGTIMPKASVMKTLGRNNVTVRVSGYSKQIAPDRNKIVKAYEESGIVVENLENMQWMDMGKAFCRNRSGEELSKIFGSCTMRDCVTINAEGKLFYCSRQMAAAEMNIYPNPKENEYIDVRKEQKLYDKLIDFYRLPYISTCNYCDGISCATTRAVTTATQILDRNTFLYLIELISVWKQDTISEGEREQLINKVIQVLVEKEKNFTGMTQYRQSILVAQEYLAKQTIENQRSLFDTVVQLVNELTEDYNFISELPFARTGKCKRAGNTLYMGLQDNEAADIVFTEDELQEAIAEKYPIDEIAYNRLYIESKLERIKKEKVSCIVSGLSYTQYGIIEKKLLGNTVNLSVTSQDIPNSIRMAEYALSLNEDISTIIMPLAIYHGFYDMTADDSFLHKEVVNRINRPLFEKEDAGNEKLDFYRQGDIFEIYNQVIDIEKACLQRDEKIREWLRERDYFNESHIRSSFGGLKFDYRQLTEQERYASAQITAQLNERICTREGYQVVMGTLTGFLENMKRAHKKVLFFAPPMTKYLYQAYSVELKKAYNDKVIQVLNNYENVQLIDLSCAEQFNDNDFCDFEHLSEEGAEKLSEILLQKMYNELY